jgi:hypothetical protein
MSAIPDLVSLPPQPLQIAGNANCRFRSLERFFRMPHGCIRSEDNDMQNIKVLQRYFGSDKTRRGVA